jgi:hypothetical protein
MATYQTAWKKSDGPVRYYGGGVEIEVGDRIELCGWFRRRRGTVNYVPGLSKAHPEMEHHSLYWVGVALDNGVFTGVIVDPDTGCTRKNIAFLKRGTVGTLAPVPDAPWE